ncbi:hypothetical protein [Aureitalea marina]|uniref:Uncharacterized protein n=1 Tax=Aureitalea marina TaxID=930804 RepID=A0A2S7KR68_9FLAO|nr:hypothetical protein [Aureitalea marina]PQB05053.1 hypothetical protein BST85_09215 [Aureitalea marina]
MRIALLLSFLFFTTLSAQQLKLEGSETLKADRFLGYDTYGNLFYELESVIHKTGPLGEFVFRDYGLGPIHSVDIINPLNVLVFYQDANTVVFLDNRLNEIERINLGTQALAINVDAATNTGNNRLWVFNVDTQQLETYNYRNQRQTIVSQPTAGEVLGMSSDFNYCYLLMEDGLHAFNVYGSALWSIPTQGMNQVVHQKRNVILASEEQIYLLNREQPELIQLEVPEIRLKDLQLTQEFLYIYDGDTIYRFTLTQPK